MFNRNIAIDKDDTLNYLTFDICKAAGLKEIPTLDVIKSGDASKEFYEARKAFFSEPSNFSNAPYGIAKKIVEIAKEHNFNPLICTKTMSGHPRGDEIVAHKFKFLREHFPETEAMIVLGRKFPDAIGMIDDSLSNCLHFNSTANRPFLVWNHQIGTTEVLNSFYMYVDDFYKESKKEEIDVSDHRFIILKTDDDGNDFLSAEYIFDNDIDIDNYTLIGSYFGIDSTINEIQINDYHIDNRLWDKTPIERELLFKQFKKEHALEIGTLEMIDVLIFNSESAIRSYSKP